MHEEVTKKMDLFMDILWNLLEAYHIHKIAQKR
jgi:hypothetical protein